MRNEINQLKNIRSYILDKVSHLTTQQLNEIPQGLNNNIIWNLGHLISAQQSICYIHADLPIVVDEKFYIPFRPNKKPEGIIQSPEIKNIKEVLIESIEKFDCDFRENIFEGYKPWLAKPYGVQISNINDAISFLNYHEGLHAGTMIAMMNLVKPV